MGWHLKKWSMKAINTYLSRGLAVIHKNQHRFKSWKWIIHVAVGQRLFEAYFRQASTTDYSGYTRDAISILKLRKHSKSNPCRWKIFINIRSIIWRRLSSKAVSVSFSCILQSWSETYLLPAPALIHYYNIDHGSKSMPLSLYSGARLSSR